MIVSFAAKKIGAADEAEKAADAADKEEGGDEGEKLSREDIKGGLTKFGIIRVGFLHHTHDSDKAFLFCNLVLDMVSRYSNVIYETSTICACCPAVR